ncbi:MAG: hypothetical protein HQM04_01855 [Magnetococcales bacterium]|nr:hypothetical protein [Magnetococcales bacterium]MBF0113764.1 hypothetical protein [Magnetococcales bacterium]
MGADNGRFLVATFCDDIRQEIGKKVSLMGCYHGALMVPSLPTVLLRFCAFVSVYTPIDRPFAALELRIMHDSMVVESVEVSPDLFLPSVDVSDDSSAYMVIHTAIGFAPFSIEEPSSIYVVANTETEGEELISQRLRILSTPSN